MSHDGVNATLPSDMTPEAITIEQAVGLLDARAGRGSKKKAPPKPRSTARKAPARPKATKPSPVTSQKKAARKAKAGK